VVGLGLITLLQRSFVATKSAGIVCRNSVVYLLCTNVNGQFLFVSRHDVLQYICIWKHGDYVEE